MTITIVSTLVWSVFVYLAVTNGADYSFDAFKNGEIFHGVVLTREIFFIATGVLIAIIEVEGYEYVDQRI